jgi:hypothetical protein
MRRRRLLPLPFAAASLGAVLALSAAANADTVGTAGAVNTATSGTAPGAPTRVIEIGTQVVANEKIQTTASGSVQVLFIDKTTLNVGPNSTLVIDRFVFNPATTKGELALSLGKGVVRVVGGIATHSEGATIRTPVAAIGLRGGIAIISHSGAKGTQAILGFGHMSPPPVFPPPPVPYSTSAGHSHVPYLTGAFAGHGARVPAAAGAYYPYPSDRRPTG